jgi:hypothetical protein
MLGAGAWESDTKLLWEILRKRPTKEAVQILKALASAGNHRFAWVDAERMFVYLIGRWSYRPDEKVWDRPTPGLDVFEYVMLEQDGQVLAAHKETRPPVATWPSWLPKRVWEM